MKNDDSIIDERIRTILSKTPGAVERLGRDIFVTTPIYKSARKYRPIYINHDYYKMVFGSDTIPPWEEMAAHVSQLFSCTIEQQNSTGEAIGTAYVDRQSDPLDVSLADNLGSGRAYYMGRFFNVKGEKTPLAQAPRKQFSDGFVEMERAIWETVVANALQGSITTGVNGVFAILDMDDLCEVTWRDHPVKRAKIIRMDIDGNFDRITHLFHAPRPLSRDDLLKTARAFGRQDADKFAERIVHGTWSPGNISLDAHLIDFDTVCAVKGRGPLYSSTQWYYQNRFGFEYDGQLKILDAMAASPAINRDNIGIEELRREMMAARTKQLGTRFVNLMGFEKADGIYAAFREEIDRLVEIWQALSRKIYKNREGFSLKSNWSVNLHVFDLSVFFRLYPIMKRRGDFSAEEALHLTLAHEDFVRDVLENAEEKPLNEIAMQHQDAVDAVIGEHYIADPSETAMLRMAAYGFIKKYDALHGTIAESIAADAKKVEAYAYAINADRVYMFPVFTVSFRLAENKDGWSDQILDSMIHALITANRRPGPDYAESYKTDIKLLKDGYAIKIVSNQGFHDRLFIPYGQKSAAESIKKIDNTEIIFYFHREYPLLINNLSISSEITFDTTDLLDNDKEL